MLLRPLPAAARRIRSPKLLHRPLIRLLVVNSTLGGAGERLTTVDGEVAGAPSNQPPVRHQRYPRPTFHRRQRGAVLADYTSSDEDVVEKKAGDGAIQGREEEGKGWRE